MVNIILMDNSILARKIIFYFRINEFRLINEDTSRRMCYVKKINFEKFEIIRF